MGKIAVGALLVLLGFSAISKHTVVGLVLLGVGALLVYLGYSDFTSSRQAAQPPTAAANARIEAAGQIADAERRAKKNVKKHRRAATAAADSAIRRAHQVAAAAQAERWVD